MAAPVTTEIRTEDTDPLVVSDAEAAHLLRDAPWRRYAVMGDSLASTIGDPVPGYRSICWADRVATALTTAHGAVEYRNTTVIGATTAQITKAQVQPILQFRPDLVHISSGGNDMLGPDPDFAEVEVRMTLLFGMVRRSGAQLCTLTTPDRFRGATMAPLRDRFRRFNEITRRVAARHDAIVVDLEDHAGRHRPDYASADNVHPSMSAQATWAAEVVRALAHHCGTPTFPAAERTARGTELR